MASSLTHSHAAGLPTLAEARPDLATQLHPELNPLGSAQRLSCGSNRKLWWRCTRGSCGHEHVWEAKVAARALRGQSCPVCGGKRPCGPGCGSLAATHPHTMAAEFDAERNLPLDPGQLLPQSHKPVLWTCRRHQPAASWVASPNKRFRRSQPTGCPECFRVRRSKSTVTAARGAHG